MPKIERAIVSVHDKQGLGDLARALVRRRVTILSSGGTASYLRDLGVPVTPISEYTGFPEILDGRVKTLHPRIFAGILARATEEHAAQLAAQQIERIDLVVVNLYPFERTVARPGVRDAEAIEMIDIGGPSLIRAAAKNHERTVVVVDPADYDVLLAEMERHDGEVGDELRRELAGRAFVRTAAYDAAIASYFAGGGVASDGQHAPESFPERSVLELRLVQRLRYGENPHQRAALYRTGRTDTGPAVVDCEQLQGKELSYNNILDADAALGLLLDLPERSVCIIKHTNPCGAATGETVAAAFRRAKEADPVSAFGGIVGCNAPVTPELAQELREMFLEAVIAPGYDPVALQTLGRKKNLRLLCYRGGAVPRSSLVLRSVSGGVLVQERDGTVEEMGGCKVVSRRSPTAEELRALDFAWRVCKHVKSNAIVFAREGQLAGVGAGQMSRVDSVKLAVAKAHLPLAGSVVASDAFFPFRDGLDEACRAGATAVVEPGGSVRDDEVIQAADEQGIALLFTGVRHFRH